MQGLRYRGGQIDIRMPEMYGLTSRVIVVDTKHPIPAIISKKSSKAVRFPTLDR